MDSPTSSTKMPSEKGKPLIVHHWVGFDFIIWFRFHHYDCLVVPIEAVTDHTNFHWEKVSLLVEYEEHKYPLFGQVESSCNSSNDISLPMNHPKLLDRLNLQSYFTLRTVLDLATSNLPSSSKLKILWISTHVLLT